MIEIKVYNSFFLTRSFLIMPSFSSSLGLLASDILTHNQFVSIAPVCTVSAWY